MSTNITKIALTPGSGGKECLGNGKHFDEKGDLIEFCCDECDYLMCCVYKCDCKSCSDDKCSQKLKEI